MGKISIGVRNRRFQIVSVKIDLRSERKPLQFRLLHHPAERSLSKEISLITATDICMSTYKPSLLDTREWSWLRNDRVFVFWVPNVPKCGGKVVTMLVDGKGVIGVQDVDA